MVIAKNRSSGTGGLGWAVYHASLGVNQVLSLNTTAASATVSGYWGSGMTSSVVSLVTAASSTGTDNCTGNMVAYCFAPVDGYSSFGSYIGNNSNDGPFVYCGFRPRFVMVKSSSFTNSETNWVIWDSARTSYNGLGAQIFPNQVYAEGRRDDNVSALAEPIDFLSNGFKIRSSFFSNNGSSGATYIYAAFAEAPFKFSNGR
jgi:hypothetical protein